MPRLYESATTGLFHRRQVEAGPGFITHDIEPDKQSIMEALNRIASRRTGGNTRAPADAEPETDESAAPELPPARTGPKVPGRCDACGRSSEGTVKLAAGNEADTIVAWAESAPPFAVARACAAFGERFAELASRP